MESTPIEQPSKKRVAFLTGGGNAPGLNAALLGAYGAASDGGWDVVGIEHGYQGLITPDQEYKDLREYVTGSMHTLLRKRGSVLYSSRTNPAPKNDPSRLAKYEEIIRENIQRNQIDMLIAIGGDDTLGALLRLSEAGIVEGNGAPKTIDNDVQNTLTFGHMTAGKTARKDIVPGMRTEADMYNRVAIIEAMGRDAGWLAMQHTNADIVLPAEFEISREQIVQRVQKVFTMNGRKYRNDEKAGHGIIVGTEGFTIGGEQTTIGEGTDAFGHGKLGGVRHRIEEWLRDAQISPMSQVPGYAYRNIQPTPKDAHFAANLGRRTMAQAIAGKTGTSSVGRLLNGDKFTFDTVPISQVQSGKLVPKELYDFDELKPAVSARELHKRSSVLS